MWLTHCLPILSTLFFSPFLCSCSVVMSMFAHKFWSRESPRSCAIFNTPPQDIRKTNSILWYSLWAANSRENTLLMEQEIRMQKFCPQKPVDFEILVYEESIWVTLQRGLREFAEAVVWHMDTRVLVVRCVWRGASALVPQVKFA